MNEPATRENTTSGLSGPQAAAATVAIFVVAVLAWGARFYFSPSPPEGKQREPAVAAKPAPGVPPIDREALCRKAWEKIAPRLDQADAASRQALEEQLAGVDEFFRARREGVKPFAEAVLSLKGKWEFAKSKLPTAEDDAHLKFLNEKFETYLFKIDDLKQTLEHAIGGYVSRVQGLEGSLLVDVRADLSEGEFAEAGLPKSLLSDAAFRREFDRALAETAAATAGDFQVTMSREVVSFVGGEVAAVVAVRVASAVAARLGVSAGVLGTGAASSWATFGLGLAAAVVVDVALSQIVKMAGYDPVQAVAEKVQGALDQVRSLLVDGNPDARGVYEKLRWMQKHDPESAVRDECRKAADSIETSGNLGLRRELEKLHEARANLRREALRRLVFEQPDKA